MKKILAVLMVMALALGSAALASEESALRAFRIPNGVGV